MLYEVITSAKIFSSTNCVYVSIEARITSYNVCYTKLLRATVFNSATMDLGGIIEVIKDAHAKGLKVARVHTGDPSIYGSIREQMEELDLLGITYEVIPGVSSFLV